MTTIFDLRVVEVRGLSSSSLSDTPPTSYCVIKCGSNFQQKTPTKSGRSASFEFVTQVPVQNIISEQLSVDVFVSGTISDTKVASIKLNLDNPAFFRGEVTDEWHTDSSSQVGVRLRIKKQQQQQVMQTVNFPGAQVMYAEQQQQQQQQQSYQYQQQQYQQQQHQQQQYQQQQYQQQQHQNEQHRCHFQQQPPPGYLG